MLSIAAAALAFSAPPSLTRREMFVGMGAAATAMAPLAAMADVSKYAGAADKKKAEFLATLPTDDPRSPSYESPYVTIMKNAAKTEADEKAVRTFGKGGEGAGGNGKTEDGVAMGRKPYDPNGCSETCKTKRLAKYGY